MPPCGVHPHYMYMPGGHVNVKVPEATRGVAGSAPDGSQPNHFAGPVFQTFPPLYGAKHAA